MVDKRSMVDRGIRSRVGEGSGCVRGAAWWTRGAAWWNTGAAWWTRGAAWWNTGAAWWTRGAAWGWLATLAWTAPWGLWTETETEGAFPTLTTWWWVWSAAAIARRVAQMKAFMLL